ncbi:MAG: chemotaxis protein CheC [Elusimicrobia bacterium]|nr:chemotaxis protein CheC [Candidatus Liberimonas magnetica]
MKKLTDLQVDTLKEVCGIGIGNAATAVSQMLKRKINMSLPKLQLVPINETAKVIGDTQTLVVGIYCKMLGDMAGGVLMTFSCESANNLVHILLNKKTDNLNRPLDELEVSALKEMGNIIAGAFVNALVKMINKDVLISVPKYAFDMMGAVIDLILIELAEVADSAVVLEIVFDDNEKEIKGNFFILPDPGSLKLLLDTVDIYGGAGSNG